MKKIVSGILASALSVCSVMSVMAADFKISAPSVEVAVEDTYTEDVKTTDITALVTELSKLTDSKDVIQQITIDSNSDKPVLVTLKLSIPEEKKAEYGEGAKTPVDYIDFRISSRDGNVLFEDDIDRAKNVYERTIILGILNNEGGSASELFNLRMSANENISASEMKGQLSDIAWSLEFNTNTDVAVATLAPDSTPTTSQTDVPTATPAPTQKVITVTVADKTDKKNDKVAEGVYGLVGIGECTVKSEDGSKNITFTLKEADKDAKIVSLEKGDVITVTGGSDAKLKFIDEDTKAAAVAASNNKTTATAKPKTTTAPIKSNPKTGDSSPVGAASAVAVLAAAGVIYAFYNRRKED